MHNHHKYLGNTPGDVQAFASPTEKLLLFLFFMWDVVCLCIHWVVQNTKHPLLFLFFSSLSCTFLCKPCKPHSPVLLSFNRLLFTSWTAFYSKPCMLQND